MAREVPDARQEAELLKRSEAFLRQVIENASGVPFQLIFGDRLGDGHYAHVGAGIEDLLGIPPAAFTERSFNAVVEEAIPLLPDIPGDPAACRRKMQEGKLNRYIADLRVKTRSGAVRWLNDSSIPLKDPKTGRVVGAIGILMDITDRKRMETALRDSEERFRSLFDRMMDGVYRSTHEGRFVEVNDAMIKMFRFASKEEMLGVDIKKELYFAPEDRESHFLDTGQEKTEVFLMRRKDGTEIWVEDHGSYVHDAGGNVIFHEGILRDVTERVKAEREIAGWKQRYELVAAASRQVVYDYDVASHNIVWSGSVRQVLGYELSEMDGGLDQWTGLIHPDDRARALRELEKAREENTPYDVEYNFLHRDGHYITMHDLGFFIVGRMGIATRMVGVMQDITERKRVELLQDATYRISEAAGKSATLKELFRAVHAIIGTVMPARNFYIALYDEKSNTISFPYFIDEVDVVSPPGRPGRSLTAYVLRTGKSLFCDERKERELHAAGEVDLIGAPSVIWLGVPLIVGERPIGVMVVQHYSDAKAYGQSDLQMLEYVSAQAAKAIERKQAEDRLRESEEQFRLISENVADMIAVLDLEGRRLYSSPSYKHVLDDPERLRGTDSFREIHEDDRERIREVFRATLRTGTGQRAEYRFVTKDGTIRHIESQGSVIKDEEGRVAKVLVVSRDVTEKKKLEQQFLRSQRMESIGTLAGGIAHDLNNVLAPILLAMEMLEKRITEPNAARMIQLVRTSAQRGSEVVKQVLAFSRGIEGERVTLQPRHIIDELVKITTETFPRSIEIRTTIEKRLRTVSADPTQMHQVLLNILVNARDALPMGGRILISARNFTVDDRFAQLHMDARPGEYVCISVADNGTGIPANVLDKIFEPFFTTKEVGKGTGLGLSTVLAIVKSHKGFLDVYSEKGKGTTFGVYIPAMMEEGSYDEDEEAADIPSGHGETILMIDDEQSVREITKNTLEAFGYQVLSASDGAEAVALYAQGPEKVDLVITDMMMPVLDGPATIRALQKLNPKVKIIAASGMIPNEELVRSSGMVRAFLTKPYSAEKLLKTINEVLLAE